MSSPRPLLSFVAALACFVCARAQTPPAASPGSLLRGKTEYARPAGRDREPERELYPIYFPPAPPALGAPIDRLGPLLDLGWQPEPEMAAFVNETFYPRLAVHLAARTLPADYAARIEAYRDARVALRRDLLAQLAKVRALPPVERLAALQTFSYRQTPLLAEQERTAEKIRGDLPSPMVLRVELNRRKMRSGPASDRGRPWELEIVRAAAFFHDGFSPAQRRLLREVALEIEAGGADAAAAKAGFYFSPDTAFVPLPPALPPEIAAKVAAFTAEKAALKKQLRDKAFGVDEARSEMDAVRELRTLAQRHEPALAALDAHAEELRRALAPFWPKPASAAPPELARRVADWTAQRSALDAEIARRVGEVRAKLLTFTHPHDPALLGDGTRVRNVDVRGVPSGRDFKTLTGHEPLARPRAVYKLLRASLDAALQATAARAEALAATRNEILRELAAVSGGDAAARATLAQLEAQQRLETDYALYFTAVTEPGLSPEQRRLLFDGALEQLALPPPGATFEALLRAGRDR